MMTAAIQSTPSPETPEAAIEEPAAQCSAPKDPILNLIAAVRQEQHNQHNHQQQQQHHVCPPMPHSNGMNNPPAYPVRRPEQQAAHSSGNGRVLRPYFPDQSAAIPGGPIEMPHYRHNYRDHSNQHPQQHQYHHNQSHYHQQLSQRQQQQYRDPRQQNQLHPANRQRYNRHYHDMNYQQQHPHHQAQYFPQQQPVWMGYDTSGVRLSPGGSGGSTLSRHLVLPSSFTTSTSQSPGPCGDLSPFGSLNKILRAAGVSRVTTTTTSTSGAGRRGAATGVHSLDPREQQQQQLQQQTARSGIDWLFRVARQHEAHTGQSLASPSRRPMSPTSSSARSSPAGGLPILPFKAEDVNVSPKVLQSIGLAGLTGSVTGDPWDLTRLEDVVDDAGLFDQQELQRRRHPGYRAAASKLHDLHVVLPIIVPGGKIVVEDVLGANFYQFPPDDKGARILFGKGVNSSGNKKYSNAAGGADSSAGVSPTTDAAGDTKMANSPSGEPSPTAGAADSEAMIPPQTCNEEESQPVCDMWGSFLNIRLGSFYNLTAEQVGLLSDLFRSGTFDRDLCRFYVPIAIDCRGVYPSNDEAISQRRSRANAGGRRENRFAAGERYETRGVPASDNDLKRLRMLRRHLRRLAIRCVSEFGFNAEGPGPRPRVELHDNAKAETLLNGTLRIVVREWGPLTHAATFRQVWAKELGDEVTERRNIFSAEVQSRMKSQKSIPSARVLAGEIRLEHSHLRMVDPRWGDELVPGRRLADRCPESEAPGPEGTFGRFVFCPRLNPPPVEYTYVAPGEDPRGAAIVSKLATLYMVHLSRHPKAGAPKYLETQKGPAAPVAAPGPSEPREEVAVAGEKGGAGDSTTATALLDEHQQPQQPRATTTTASESGRAFSAAGCSSFDVVAAPFVPLLRPELEASSAQFPPVLRNAALGLSEEPAVVDVSAVLPDAPASPPSSYPCKFYLRKTGCARGTSCMFWHPADEQMQSPLDIRQITPLHPKFF